MILRDYKLGVKIKFLSTKWYVFFYVCVFFSDLVDNGRFWHVGLLTSSVIWHDNRLLSTSRQRATTGDLPADGRPAPKNAIIIGIGRWVLKYDRFAGRVLVVKWGPVAKCRGDGIPHCRVPGRETSVKGGPHLRRTTKVDAVDSRWNAVTDRWYGLISNG